jgi:structural maintenance of chromosome 2
MKLTISEQKVAIANAKSRQDEATKDIKRIERDMKEFNSNKDSKLAELQSSLDKLKKALTKSKASIKPLQQEMRDAMVEAEQCGGDLTTTQEQLQDVKVTISSQHDEIKNLISERDRVKDAHDIAQAHLQDEQAKLSGFDDELKSIENAVRSKNSQITEESLEQQKLGHQIEKLDTEHSTAGKTLSALSKSYDWIEDEKDQFGRQGTPYDFKGHNMAECKSTLKKKEEQVSGMKKKINPKVMNMIDNVEKKEASLKNKMKTVIRDKRKIEETIESLDHYKKDALQKTWEKVNGDFGQIFNELLPGSFAKLDPPEGKTISDGLEVKVSLGKVWKQSLTELSGGQRYVKRCYIHQSLTSVQIPHCTITHHGTTSIQTCTNVHS